MRNFARYNFNLVEKGVIGGGGGIDKKELCIEEEKKAVITSILSDEITQKNISNTFAASKSAGNSSCIT